MRQYAINASHARWHRMLPPGGPATGNRSQEMAAKIRVVGMYNKITAGVAVDTTSRSGRWSGLSPFNLGPCSLYNSLEAQNFENAWQYAKVYKAHADANGNPTQAYWDWAMEGWANPKAVRYPMGRGAKPLYSLWDGNRLGYIEARKTIYGPIYADLVQQTQSWRDLQTLHANESLIVLRDYDGYDHDDKGLNFVEVLNNPAKKMGHAFVLKMLLEQDPALAQFC